jgi:hypothetical protein
MQAETLWTMASSGHSSGNARPQHLLIISRYHPALYDYVRQRFAGEQNVEVILDRRNGRDRRAERGEPPVERRAAAERRTRPGIDAALRMESMQFLTLARDASAPKGGSA